MEKHNHSHGIHGVGLILPALVLGVSIILGALLATGYKCPMKSERGRPHSIAVSGEGRVFAAPDMMTMTVSSSELAPSTKDAQAKVNTTIAQSLEIIKQKSVKDEDVQTTNISIRPEYDWTDAGRKFKGYRATQTLSIKIHNIDPKTNIPSELIDGLAAIGGLQIDNLDFTIEDSAKIREAAREKAYRDAEQKATALANLSDMKILDPIAISTDSLPEPMPMMAEFRLAKQATAGAPPQIPPGQLEIVERINVVWGMR